MPRARKKQSSLRDDIFKTLKNWHEVKVNEELTHLYKLRTVRQRLHSAELSIARAYHDAAKSLIDEVSHSLTKPEEQRFLQLRFKEERPHKEVISLLELDEPYKSKSLQDNMLLKLTELVTAKENNLQNELRQKFSGKLFAKTYDELIGSEKLVDEIHDLLSLMDDPYFISISGIGGIGKTALADAATRRILQTASFYDFVWWRVTETDKVEVNGRLTLTSEAIINNLNEKLGLSVSPVLTDEDRHHRLQQRLKRESHFIVIDNIETEQDAQTVSQTVARLAKPTKFLVTTRHIMPDSPSIYRFPIGEKTAEQAATILRSYADANNTKYLAQAENEVIEKIVTVAGGNPLALKLIAGLIRWRPLSDVLRDLVKAFSTDVRELYTNIYRQSWESLSENGRNLLEIMPLVGHAGGTLEQLQHISELPHSKLIDSIQELISRSLIELRRTQDLWDPSYGIHRLTESFLKTEIIGLFDDGSEEN